MADNEAPSFVLRALLAFLFGWSFRAMVFLLMGAWVLTPSWLPEGTPNLLRFGGYLFTVLTAGGVLRALVFIPDRFHPPTPPLGPEEHRALQDLVIEVASALETQPPQRIYFLPDVNAFVRESRGPLGFGSKRSLTLGVGLLESSTVSELRATIAHELAHFVGGDTRLSLSLARTRQGMFVLMEEMGTGIFSRPIRFYVALFFIFSQDISRSQELWADRAAVRIAGRGPAQTSLRNIVTTDVLFNRMLVRGLPFVLGCGFAPRNIFASLRAAQARDLYPEARAAVDEALREKPASTFDSHPPHDERIRYAAAQPEPDGLVQDDRPALELLDDPGLVEVTQTAALYTVMRAPELPPIEDDDMMERAVVPTLELTAERARARVVEMFGDSDGSTDEAALRALLEMAARSASAAGSEANPTEAALADALRDEIGPEIGALLTNLLIARGGVLSFDLVERPFVATDDASVSPFDEASRAVSEPAVATEWLERLWGEAYKEKAAPNPR